MRVVRGMNEPRGLASIRPCPIHEIGSPLRGWMLRDHFTVNGCLMMAMVVGWWLSLVSLHFVVSLLFIVSLRFVVAQRRFAAPVGPWEGERNATNSISRLAYAGGSRL